MPMVKVRMRWKQKVGINLDKMEDIEEKTVTSQINKGTTKCEKMLKKLAENFPSANDKSDSVLTDNQSDIYSDTNDEEYFVTMKEVSESEDELEIVNKEPFDMEPTDEITETEEIGEV
ncbi:hypothetical protein FQA39_LY18218 [Lamprigera yunnana]|nr:hypothetical protein FQA39_LY18218 [Lamprigera yunnana]